jgi:ribosomal protein L11 methylase PrmA
MKTFYQLVKSAKQTNRFTEEVMWDSVEDISKMLEEIKESNPKHYWKFMRRQTGLMNGYIYDEDFALHDVSKMKWHDKEGKEHTGEYWSCQQVREATKDMKFPSIVNDWTKYVAFNASATDLIDTLSDDMILKVAYKEWFRDEDWDESNKEGYSPTKIWEYMCGKFARED